MIIMINIPINIFLIITITLPVLPLSWKARPGSPVSLPPPSSSCNINFRILKTQYHARVDLGYHWWRMKYIVSFILIQKDNPPSSSCNINCRILIKEGEGFSSFNPPARVAGGHFCRMKKDVTAILLHPHALKNPPARFACTHSPGFKLVVEVETGYGQHFIFAHLHHSEN